MKEADSLGIEGTPYLFVDGEHINGALPAGRVWAVIDRALRAAGVEPPAREKPRRAHSDAGQDSVFQNPRIDRSWGGGGGGKKNFYVSPACGVYPDCLGCGVFNIRKAVCREISRFVLSAKRTCNP